MTVRYPLTPLDNNFASAIMVLGWLFEGKVDEEKFRNGLERLIKKWPMLGGRIGHDRTEGLHYIFLDPKENEKYILSSHNSDKPINAYVPITTCPPVSPSYPISCPSIPISLMSPTTVPRTTDEWINRLMPLLVWHIEHFPDGYTCVGLTYSHAWLDGYGFSLVVKRLVYELSGRGEELGPISLPAPGSNQLAEVINGFRAEIQTSSVVSDSTALDTEPKVSSELIPFTPPIIQPLQRHGQCLVFISPDKLAALYEGRGPDISRGDIISSFLLKLFQSLPDVGGPQDELPVVLKTVASLHSAVPFLASYPHNSVITFPHTPLSPEKLASHSVHSLAVGVGKTRREFRTNMKHAFVKAYDHHWQAHLPAVFVSPHSFEDPKRAWVPPNDERWVIISNMSAYDIANVDWSGCLVGSEFSYPKECQTSSGTSSERSITQDGVHRPGTTILRFKDTYITNPQLPNMDFIIIVGYLVDGTLFIHTELPPHKLKLLLSAIEKIPSGAILAQTDP